MQKKFRSFYIIFIYFFLSTLCDAAGSPNPRRSLVSEPERSWVFVTLARDLLEDSSEALQLSCGELLTAQPPSAENPLAAGPERLTVPQNLARFMDDGLPARRKTLVAEALKTSIRIPKSSRGALRSSATNSRVLAVLHALKVRSQARQRIVTLSCEEYNYLAEYSEVLKQEIQNYERVLRGEGVGRAGDALFPAHLFLGSIDFAQFSILSDLRDLFEDEIAKTQKLLELPLDNAALLKAVLLRELKILQVNYDFLLELFVGAYQPSDAFGGAISPAYLAWRRALGLAILKLWTQRPYNELELMEHYEKSF